MKHLLLTCLSISVVSVSMAGAQETAEISLVKETLSNAQIQSIAQNREYCGYFGFDDAGTLVSSRVTMGQIDGCTPDWPDDLEVVASWHTHAGYDEGAWSEVPTVMDIEADESEGVDGYVGTPGGRVWYIDTLEMEVSQICGLGCIRNDPKFVKGSEGVIEQSYTYEEMLAREAANE